MEGDRRKPSNAALRRAVLAGHCMEFEIARLIDQGPDYSITEKDCERLALMRESWTLKIAQLRDETTSNVVHLAQASAPAM